MRKIQNESKRTVPFDSVPFDSTEKRRFFAALAVLAVLIVIYAAQCITESRDQAAVPETIVSYTADEIAEVTWTDADGTERTVTRDSSDEAGLFFASLTGIAISRTIENPEDLVSYGLDAPQIEARITGTDGTEETFSISSVEQNTGLVYVIKNSDESRIYAVRSGFADAFS